MTDNLAVGAPHNSPLTSSGTVRFFSVPHGLHRQLVGSTGARFGQSLAAIGETLPLGYTQPAPRARTEAAGLLVADDPLLQVRPAPFALERPPALRREPQPIGAALHPAKLHGFADGGARVRAPRGARGPDGSWLELDEELMDGRPHAA